MPILCSYWALSTCWQTGKASLIGTSGLQAMTTTGRGGVLAVRVAIQCWQDLAWAMLWGTIVQTGGLNPSIQSLGSIYGLLLSPG
jgi:hypothetical protein